LPDFVNIARAATNLQSASMSISTSNVAGEVLLVGHERRLVRVRGEGFRPVVDARRLRFGGARYG
jgi:hypothetical protein